ncbi:MAG: hypothetical protein KDB36_01910 [Acidimicrobiales bacterium]|nr:hypothetical protein [Acidimicrobiales bacterium]
MHTHPAVRRRAAIGLAAVAVLGPLAVAACAPNDGPGAEDTSPDSDAVDHGGGGSGGGVTGTVSPQGTAIASSTTARATPPAPDAVRSVDFTSFAFPPDSCGDMFHETPVEGFEMDGGQVQGGHDDETFAVYLRPDITYGDVDGDGVEEALVILDCTPGNRPYGFASVWTPDGDGGAERLVQVATNIGTDTGRGDHWLEEAALTPDGSINVTWQVFGEGDAACCPAEQAQVTLVWRDGALVPAAPAVYAEAPKPG